ncbi:MAG: ABC transporter permease [Acidimicrobiales bacterium]
MTPGDATAATTTVDGVTAPPATTRPNLRRDVSVLGARAVSGWTRNPASIVGAIVFPIVFFVLFNLVMRRIMTARGFDYAQLLPATVVVQAMFFTAMASAYYVAADRVAGMSGRFRSLPIHGAAPILARSVGDVSRATVSVVVLVIVGVIAGLRFRAGVPAVVGFVLVALVFAAVVSVGMGMIGLRAATPDAAASIASVPYLPLLMLSNGFAPVEDFPGWLQGFVEHQPVTRTIDLLRALVVGGPTLEPFTWWVGWMIGLAIVFVPLAAWAAGRST